MSSEQCYGVLGWPLGHSASPALMGRLMEERQCSYPYALLAYPEYPRILGLASEHRHLMGFNVTLPYKIKMFQEIFFESKKNATWSLSPEALACGAVNCVRLHRDTFGSVSGVTGHNTDAQGFAAALAVLEPNRLEGPALVMGDGGASKAVVHVLHTMGIACTQLSRKITGHSTPNAKVQTLLAWEHAEANLIHNHPLLVQCTPIGMWPSVTEMPPLPTMAMEGIGPHHRVMDLIYRPERTLFLEQCAARGAHVLGGWTMLEQQAIASLEFWLA
ncbi:MAG: hypothetical protein FJ336_06230 [Sphingomonadales bacterium]|nr:hypothetical protein [Sphingomonadales bacterium]